MRQRAGRYRCDSMDKRFGCVDRALNEAIGSWATAIVARVQTGDRVLFERAYGATRDDGGARPVYVDTRFDLASITKLFVSTCALQLAAEQRLDLDEPAVRWIPEWQNRPHAAVTARMLLAHTGGMYSGADYRTLFDRNVEHFALTRELLASPGERVIYSDLGMIALGTLVARIEGKSLGAVVAQRTNRSSVEFMPAERERTEIPATEKDGWRGRVQGRVHDEKAALMNGVSGHAGLFGTAADVAWLTKPYLDAAAGREQMLLPSSLACAAIEEAAYDPVLRRGLGWALKTNDDNSCGRYFSPRSFGHTGFTGTCVWADPDRDLQAVLLTNSVYYGRRDSRPLRAAFYEGIVEAIAS